LQFISSPTRTLNTKPLLPFIFSQLPSSLFLLFLHQIKPSHFHTLQHTLPFTHTLTHHPLTPIIPCTHTLTHPTLPTYTPHTPYLS
ncbi:hypothetical protein VIGAN_06163100, partial [Vigna angularis var. angularis]